MKKLVIATIVAYIVLMATNYFVHSVWLKPDYDAIASSHRTIEGIMHRFWAMALGQFFFAAMFSYIYSRGRENKSWLEQGIRYGIVMTFMTVVPYSLSEYVVYIVTVHAGDQVDGCWRNSTHYSGLDRSGNLQGWRYGSHCVMIKRARIAAFVSRGSVFLVPGSYFEGAA